MAQFKANPVIVNAFQITDVRPRDDDDGVDLSILVNGKDEDRHAESSMISHMFPVPGDYWVIQHDGYVYLYPKAVFEKKYSPYDEAAGKAAAAEAAKQNETAAQSDLQDGEEEEQLSLGAKYK